MMTYIIIGVVIGLGLLLCFLLAVANFSWNQFYDKYKENEARRNSFGITTLQYVSQINQQVFQGKLKLTKTAEFRDFYGGGIVGLSQQTMNSNSLASLAIVSHELGHARQDFSSDKLKKHNRMRLLGRICGLFFMPLLIAGAVLSILQVLGVLEEIYFLYIGAGCGGVAILIFLFAIFLKYKEIQIEKEASDFAIEFLEQLLTPPEVEYCKELLDSARLTYWAALIRTLLSWTLLTPKNTLFK